MNAQELYQALVNKVATYNGEKVIELSHQGQNYGLRQVNGGSFKNDVLWFSESVLLSHKQQSIATIAAWIAKESK